MKAALLIIAIIFAILGSALGVLTYRSYTELTALEFREPVQGASFLSRLVDLEKEAHANVTPQVRSVRMPFRMGTPLFRKYEEFQNHSLLAFLCYLSGYTAYYVTRRVVPLSEKSS